MFILVHDHPSFALHIAYKLKKIAINFFLVHVIVCQTRQKRDVGWAMSQIVAIVGKSQDNDPGKPKREEHGK